MLLLLLRRPGRLREVRHVVRRRWRQAVRWQRDLLLRVLQVRRCGASLARWMLVLLLRLLLLLCKQGVPRRRSQHHR